MIKRIFTLILAIATVLSLCACSTTKDPYVAKVRNRSYRIDMGLSNVIKNLGVSDNTTINPGETREVDVKDEEGNIYTWGVYNNTKSEKEIKKCTLKYIRINTSKIKDLDDVIFSSYNIKSSYADVVLALGLSGPPIGEHNQLKYYYWTDPNNKVGTIAAFSKDNKMQEIILGNEDVVKQWFDTLYSNESQDEENRYGASHRAFTLNNKSYYLGMTFNMILDDFKIIGGQDVPKTLNKNATEIIMISNDDAVLAVGVYNDVENNWELAKCKVGFVQMLSRDAINWSFEQSIFNDALTTIKKTHPLIEKIDFGGYAYGDTMTNPFDGAEYSEKREQNDGTVAYVWRTNKLQTEIICDSENKVIGKTFGLRGIFFHSAVNKDDFDELCVMIIGDRKYYLNQPLSEALRPLVVSPSDPSFIDGKQTISVMAYSGLFDYYAINKDRYEFEIKNISNQLQKVETGRVIGITITANRLENITKNTMSFAGGITFDCDYDQVVRLIGNESIYDSATDTYYWVKQDYVISIIFDNDDHIQTIKYAIP